MTDSVLTNIALALLVGIAFGLLALYFTKLGEGK